MTRPRDPKPPRKRNVIPMELDNALLAEVAKVSEETGESKATIMRLAIRAGLPAAREAILKLGGGKYPPHEPRNLLLNEDGKKPKP